LVVPWRSFALVGPRFEPADSPASYPLPADEGRGWKYSGLEKPCPIALEPTTFPFTSTMLPFACLGKMS
jgi:hypothetical protein